MKKFTLLFLGASLLALAYWWTNATISSPTTAEQQIALNQEIDEMLSEADDEFDKLYRVDKMYELELEKTQTAQGMIPRKRLIKSYDVLEARKNELASKSGFNPVPWEERGPNNIGGRTRTIMFDARDNTNNSVFVGSVGGGIWRTTNFLTSEQPTWLKVNDYLENIAITALVQDPNPARMNEIYAGTGEGWRNADRITGIGIFKSTDGGATFSLLPSTSSFNTTQKLVFDANGNLFAATDVGVQMSTDQGTTWTKVLGMDGGTSGGANLPNHDYAADIEIAADGSIWAGFGRIFLDGFVFKSATGAAGSWTNIMPSLQAQRVKISVAPSDADVVYVMAEDPQGGFEMGNNPLDPFGTNATFFYRTIDGGTTFLQMASPRFCDQAQQNNFTRNQAWYDLATAVSPTNSMVYIVGGVDALISINGGASFNQITSWTGGNLCPNLSSDQLVHADQHTIQFLPGSGDEAVWGTDGGISYTANVNALPAPTFIYKNLGYNVTQYYAADLGNELGSDEFLAGAQDNGTHRFVDPGINSVVEISGGDGAFCHIDQDNPNIQVSSFVFNSYFITNNRWGSNSRVTPSSSAGRFINPTDYDDANDILYACADADAYIRIDGVGDSNSASTISVDLEGGEIAAIIMSPNTPHTFFCTTDDGSANGRNDKVFKVENANTATPIVTRIDNGQLPNGAGAYFNCIQVENGDDDHLIVVLSNFGAESIWESKDGGANWTNVEGDLPDMPVRWAVFNPNNNDALIIATELGVWTTDDLDGDDTVWTPTGSASGFPNVRTDMIKVREIDNVMVAATHGRGIYTTNAYSASGKSLTFNSGLTQVTEGGSQLTTDVCPRAFQDVEVKFTLTQTDGFPTVTVLVNPTSTATAGTDYDILNDNLTFDFTNNGPSEQKTVTVRIYDDASVEGAENLILTFQSLPTGADAGFFLTHTISINDNDVAPALSNNASITIIDENFTDADFSSGLWEVLTVNGTGPNTWVVGTSNVMNSLIAAVITDTTVPGDTDNYGGADADDNSNDVILSTREKVDLRGISDINLTFDWGAGGEADIPALGETNGAPLDFGELVFSTDKVNWQSLEVFIGAGTGAAAPLFGNYDSALPVFEGQEVFIGFRWLNDVLLNGLNSFGVDNIVLTGSAKKIESQLNDNVSAQVGMGDNAFFFSTQDGDLIVSLDNANMDLGCTEASVSQAGTGSEPLEDGKRSEKKIMVDNSNNATYEVVTYFTIDELGDFTEDPMALRLVKINGSNNFFVNPEVTPVMDAADGTTIIGYAYKGSFTGFGEFAVTNATTQSDALAVNWLNVAADLINNKQANITWTTANERDNKGFNVQRSLDGVTFENIGFVKGQNTARENSYKFVDNALKTGVHFYRIEQVDNSGKPSLSTVVAIKVIDAVNTLTIVPNPVRDAFSIQIGQDITQATIEVYTINGQLATTLQRNAPLNGSVDFNVKTANLVAGTYIVRVAAKDRVWTQQLIVQ